LETSKSNQELHIASHKKNLSRIFEDFNDIATAAPPRDQPATAKKQERKKSENTTSTHKLGSLLNFKTESTYYQLKSESRAEGGGATERKFAHRGEAQPLTAQAKDKSSRDTSRIGKGLYVRGEDTQGVKKDITISFTSASGSVRPPHTIR
jgi:hypothetical protein